MPSSVKWILAGFGFCAAGFACTLKARQELDKEKEAVVWRESVSELRESSSSQSWPPDLPSFSTGPESSMPSPEESKNDG